MKVKDFFNQEKPHPNTTWEEWWKEFHKMWFWGENGGRVVVGEDGEITFLPQGTSYHPEDWKKVLFTYPTPGPNNMDTSEYEEEVGVWNEEKGRWEWHENIKRWEPEIVKKKPYPSWKDIINLCIDTGDWQDWYEFIKKEVIEEDERN